MAEPSASEEADPGTPNSPLVIGFTLWRESVLASLGTLALLTGLHGWWFLLGNGLDQSGYTVTSLVGDLAYVFAGLLLVVAAVGSATLRIRSR